MAEEKITICGDQSELGVKKEVKITPCGDQSELRVKEEVKIISIEEKGSRKKRRQNRKRRKKVTEGEADTRKTEEGITPEPPTLASNTQKSDSPEENRARKRKRTRRKNRNKKTQEVIEGELTGDKETTCCPSLHAETQMNSVKSELNSEKETSLCPSLHDETQPNSVKSSTTASRKRANRRKKNKWKTAEADRVAQLQSSDLINAVDIKVEVAKSGEGCLNVTNVEERKAQENGEVQRRRKRPRNRRKATVSEDHGKFLQPCGTVANTLLTGENGQPAVVSGQPAVVSGQLAVVSGQPAVVSGQPAVVSGQLAVVSGQPAVVSGQATVTNKKKRRNRKRKRSQSVPGDSTMNTSLTKKLTLVVKEDKVREDGESVPHQNTETESSTNQKKKKKRQRNKRRKQQDKDEDKNEIKIGIDLIDDSHESGVEIINGTDNTNNRKRNLAVDAENLDNKKMKLGDIEEMGTNSVVLSSVQPQQQGNKEPGKKKRRRKRKKKHIESVGGSCQDLSSIMAVTDENKDGVSSSPGDGESQSVSKQSNSPPYKKLTKEKTVLKSWSSDVSVCVCAEINPLYNEESTREKINKHWSDGEGHLCKGSGLEVIQDPFTCCFLPNFLKEADFLEGVRDELQDIELVMNNNDLYKFRQTSNLNDVNSPHIAALRNFLYGDFRRWLVDVTGLPLNDNVYMTSSRYEYTDVLLCHDDELEGRRIAFILYLVPQWLEEDGGSLDLFSVDGFFSA
ncbi:uncharacterized protein LOC121861115 [Homarus americanus]|uniref:uncharacterized protein LOC121861115 n=1 Tax=Homarus americanus TaxID=6706 RepID=UPI001C474A56|nr:uncharacterized protein LOC121861115 [Homarus americanus]